MDTASKVLSSAHGQDMCSKDPAGCMRAVVWTGKSIKLEHIAKPKILEPTDVVVKVTACSMNPDFPTTNGSGLEKNQVLGSEAVGIVDSVGDGVEKFVEGDRVAVSVVLSRGTCKHCCLNLEVCNCTNASEEFKQTHGVWLNVLGAQAEYVRVPFADTNCFKLRWGVSDDKALLGVETGAKTYDAVHSAYVKRGNCVAIWGLGPIGLQAAHWCEAVKARVVVGVDYCPERLKFARDHMNLRVIDRSKLSSAQMTAQLQQFVPPAGADVVIDATGRSISGGFLAKSEETMGTKKQSATDTLNELLMIARESGYISIVSDYMGAVDSFPTRHVATKGVTIYTSRGPVQKYYRAFDNSLDPSILISHRLTLEEVPEAYARTGKKESGFLKVFVAPHRRR